MSAISPSEVTWKVALVSLGSVPTCMAFYLASSFWEQHAWLLMLAGALVCFGGLPLLFSRIRTHNGKRANATTAGNARAPGRFWFYVFCVFNFTCVIDLLMGLNIDALDPFQTLHFYLEAGEPYLKNSFGSLQNYWDGTVHFALYLYFIHGFVAGRGVDWLHFFYVGSIGNSMLVYLPAGAVGRFGGEVQASYLLNTPYFFLPLAYGYKIFQQSESGSPSPAVQKAKRRTLAERPVDVLLCVYVLVAIVITCIRALAAANSPFPAAVWWRTKLEPVLGDGDAYPLMQSLVFLFYGVPFLVCCMAALAVPSARQWSHLGAWSVVHMGAAAQGYFSYLGPLATFWRYVVKSPYDKPQPEWVGPVPHASLWVPYCLLQCIGVGGAVALCWRLLQLFPIVAATSPKTPLAAPSRPQSRTSSRTFSRVRSVSRSRFGQSLRVPAQSGRGSLRESRSIQAAQSFLSMFSARSPVRTPPSPLSPLTSPLEDESLPTSAVEPDTDDTPNGLSFRRTASAADSTRS